MKKIMFFILILNLFSHLFAQEAIKPESGASPCCKVDKLDVLWTTGDKEVFTKVVFPYSLNSKKMEWWSSVELIVWGPSSKLLAEDEELQKAFEKLKEEGVILTACKWCSDQYGVSDILIKLGVDVKYMGKPLTEYLKSGEKVLVF